MLPKTLPQKESSVAWPNDIMGLTWVNLTIPLSNQLSNHYLVCQ